MEPTVEANSANRQIARAAGTVMAAYLATKVLGILSTILIARTFGTGPDNDAYVAANRFAEILFNLGAGGALASAFIPMLTQYITRDDRPGVWRFASAISNIVATVLVTFSVISMIFAPWIVSNILAPGFTDAYRFNLCVALLRVQLPSVVLFGISILMTSILNAHQHFLFPAIAPAMYSLGQIIGIWVLSPSMGVYGLAWGVVLGAGLHLLVQVPNLLRLSGRHYQLGYGLHLPEVRETALLIAPRLVGVMAVQVNFLVSTAIASHMVDGSVTAIYLAFTLMLMPEATIAQAAATAALPTFSAQVARGKEDEMRGSLAATLRVILLLTLPAMLGLILLRYPLVEFLFQFHSFTAASTELVVWALLWYSVGLIGHSVVEVVSRAFYALHDTRTPVTIGVAAMALNVGMSYGFSWLFAQVGWMPHGGLALAMSAATALEMVALLVFMRRRLNGLQGKTIWNAVWKGTIGTLVMSAVIWGWLQFSQGRSALWISLGGVGLGIVVYGLVLLALRVPELSRILSLASGAVGRLFRRKGSGGLK
jgi:putative peptidoglycan lipid II flippase